MPKQSTLTRLLQSKSNNAKLLGLAVSAFMFAPCVFRVLGDEKLTVYQRLEQISIAVAQTLLTVAVAAIPPESLSDEPEPDEDEEDE